jgi:hypothetical protein
MSAGLATYSEKSLGKIGAIEYRFEEVRALEVGT